MYIIYTYKFHSGVGVNYIEVAGYDYFGNNIGGSYESSFEDCANKCLRTNGCVGFSHDELYDNCWMKSKMAASNLIEDGNIRSGFVKGTFRMEQKLLRSVPEFSKNIR